MRGQSITLVCPQCGAEFVPGASQRWRIANGAVGYCSRRCYGDSKMRTVVQHCLVCDERFETRPSRVAAGFGIYCGKPCSNKARAVPEADRFWALVEKADGDACWLWKGARDDDGYGLFALAVRGQMVAHRYAYQIEHGPIDATVKVLHRCDNPPCVRGSHLFTGSNADNMADMVSKGRSLTGEKHPRAKLTVADVIAIREAHARGVTVTYLAEHYGVVPGTIYHVITRQHWNHV